MKNLKLIIYALLCLSIGTAKAQLSNLYSFTSTASPYGSLTPNATGTLFYGMTYSGGSHGEGNIFSITPSGTYTSIYSFGTATNDGENPKGSLVLWGNVLFGMTSQGGTYGYGVIFSYNLISTTFTVIHQFGSITNDGENPYASLLHLGGRLYGTTYYGGSQGIGTVFSTDVTGSAYTSIYSFSGTSNCYQPAGSLITIGSGGVLYGMAGYGGAHTDGAIFSINTNGSNYQDIYDFTTGGYADYASLVEGTGTNSNMVYGMIPDGGVNYFGCVFSFNLTSSVFTDMHDFQYSHYPNPPYTPFYPYGSLVISGGTLYGMTSAGGNNASGQVFSINADGSSYTNLGDLDPTSVTGNGATPYGDLTLGDGVLYGMSSQGLAYSYDGNIFSLTTCDLGTTASAIGVTCIGTNTGSATADPTYGVSPYTYLWLPGPQSGQTASGLSAGPYTVTVTDNTGCTATATVTVTQPVALSAIAYQAVSVSCYTPFGLEAYAQGYNGTSPYTYLWSVGGTSQLRTGLAPNTYTVTVTDNCGATATASATLTEPSQVTVTLSGEYCNLGPGTGGGTATGGGGTSPYGYLWEPGGLTNSTEGGLSPDTYTITVTDNNGCTGTTTMNVCPTLHHKVVNDAGDSTISELADISFYPNPTNGQFAITGLDKGMIVEVYDYMGKLVKNTTTLAAETIQVNLSGQANGIYLVRIISSDGSLVKTTKIIKTE